MPTVLKLSPQNCVSYRTEIQGIETVKMCISRLTQNDYHQYKFRLRKMLADSNFSVSQVLIKYMSKVLRRINIWYHEKCTQRTFTVSKIGNNTN